jgi:hypothetical protein
MKRDTIKYLVLFLIMAFPLAGCEKFLETPIQGTLTQEEFPTTANDALLATNACYSAIRDWYYNFGGYPITDIMSDDARKGSNPNDQANTVGPYDNFTITTTQDGLDRWWAADYVTIKYCNVVIEKVPSIDMNTTLQIRYIAEAKFIRALAYFDMVRAWGGVPLVTTVVPPQKLQRASVDDTYALIIQDLEFAIGNLPERNQYDPVDMGRATKGAAQGMLAKVYLFRHDYANSEKYLMEVINSGQYGLEPVFIDANGVNGQNGIESLFEVNALQVDGTTGGGDQWGNVQGVRGSPNRGWGFNRPTIDLRNSYSAGDPRYPGTVINLNDTLDGVVILGDGDTPDVTKDSQGNIIEIECYNRKVWVPGNNVATQFGHHRRILRYADVLLMAAEVLNENNKPGEALLYLNMVRERARQGNPNILPDITTTNQSELRDIIFTERRLELAMEGHRFWDLIRTGRAQQAMGPLGFVSGKDELLPIPQSEIDKTAGTEFALQQNPGYN